MANEWIDQQEINKSLSKFFIATETRDEIQRFGSTVNQTFEAFVFASVIKWYEQNGWRIKLIHPDKKTKLVKLKFSTRGKPDTFTYALCIKGRQKIQIRHGLRVATKHHRKTSSKRANIVLDVAVISNINLASYKTDDQVDNIHLLTFGEAKHMSAFAELVAGFIGLVHEMMPDNLLEKRSISKHTENVKRDHPAPFLYVSGHLNPTAQGILETINYRGYDIDIYDQNSGIIFGLTLPKMSIP